MMDVFINDVAAFLPNSPVSNDDIETVLGRLSRISSKIRNIVLKNNKIKTRHYAIDPMTGHLTHSNAQLTAAAVRKLTPYDGFNIRDIQCLCCGTSTPDLLFPGHALMVLGQLGAPPCEAMTASGICISGMAAFKYAWMNVSTGMSQNAVATGSELASSFTRSAFLRPLFNEKNAADVIDKPIQAFDADFLRWMLSDGAGAVFLSSQKNADRISLKVDWIEHISFAGNLDLCMYGGGVKRDGGAVVGWREIENIAPEEIPFLFSIRQDIKLLDKEIIRTMGRVLSTVVEKHGLVPSDIAWYLPHYSSDYFRPQFYDEMIRIGFEIPYEKWFTNLSEKGNTGSAAIFIILEELFHSGKLKPGDKLLCFIPESGRFSHCFMMLTAV
jgi:3-oxoacyl-[acyl-carrier-protein] synthase-3